MTQISQPKNKTYPHKYKFFSFYEDCHKIGAYNSHHQDEAQQKHVLMFNKLSKLSTFSYKFSCKFEQCDYIQKPYFKPYTLPLNPSNPYTLQLTPQSTLPNICELGTSKTPP
jgi:hypothetical protein